MSNGRSTTSGGIAGVLFLLIILLWGSSSPQIRVDAAQSMTTLTKSDFPFTIEAPNATMSCQWLTYSPGFAIYPIDLTTNEPAIEYGLRLALLNLTVISSTSHQALYTIPLNLTDSWTATVVDTPEYQNLNFTKITAQGTFAFSFYIFLQDVDIPIPTTNYTSSLLYGNIKFNIEVTLNTSYELHPAGQKVTLALACEVVSPDPITSLVQVSLNPYEKLNTIYTNHTIANVSLLGAAFLDGSFSVIKAEPVVQFGFVDGVYSLLGADYNIYFYNFTQTLSYDPSLSILFQGDGDGGDGEEGDGEAADGGTPDGGTGGSGGGANTGLIVGVVLGVAIVVFVVIMVIFIVGIFVRSKRRSMIIRAASIGQQGAL